MRGRDTVLRPPTPTPLSPALVFRDPAWLVFPTTKNVKWVAVVGKSGTILLETWGEVPSILDPSEYWSWKDLRRQLAR